jgi:aryl-alcohol dehydrogenase-like predicted oxidoreductase
MKKRTLGPTDLALSEVGFGVWTVATNWWGKISPEDGVKLLQRAVDLGVNFFDTADGYGDGFGEQIVADALKTRRHQLIYATKFGYDFYNNPYRVGHAERPQNWDPKFVRSACEQSLRRLRTDYIDLYQLHNPKMDAIRSADLYGLLDDLVREGKIRYYGVALGPDIGWEEEGMAALTEMPNHMMQVIYSILEQQPARNFFPVAREHKVGLLARVPHASDILTDRYVKEPPKFEAGDHRAHRRQQWLQEAMRKRAQLTFLAKEGEMTMAQAAIRFCLSEQNIASVLPNITSMEQLEEYTAAGEHPDLEPHIVERLWDLYDTGFGLAAASGSSSR